MLCCNYEIVSCTYDIVCHSYELVYVINMTYKNWFFFTHITLMGITSCLKFVFENKMKIIWIFKLDSDPELWLPTLQNSDKIIQFIRFEFIFLCWGFISCSPGSFCDRFWELSLMGVEPDRGCITMGSFMGRGNQ